MRGLQVNSWHEHLSADDIPPERIWNHTEELTGWFDRIKSKYKNGGSSNYESVPEGEMTQFDNADVLAQLQAP